jgi:hypothetical protein
MRALGAEAIYLAGEADFSNMVRRNIISMSLFRHRCDRARVCYNGTPQNN